MRSYLDVIIDVKDGKRVDYEELRVALLLCRDMLFFVEQDAKKLLENSGELNKQFVKNNLESLFKNRKNPMEYWWNGDIPQIKE